MSGTNSGYNDKDKTGYIINYENTGDLIFFVSYISY